VKRTVALPSLAHARCRHLRRRAEILLAEDPVRRIDELDRLLTDACATVLMLEGRQVRLQRVVDALGPQRGDAAHEASCGDELSRRAAALRAQIAEVRALVEVLAGHRRAHERARRR
jgi:hypothetical protein